MEFPKKNVLDYYLCVISGRMITCVSGEGGWCSLPENYTLFPKTIFSKILNEILQKKSYFACGFFAIDGKLIVGIAGESLSIL